MLFIHWKPRLWEATTYPYWLRSLPTRRTPERAPAAQIILKWRHCENNATARIRAARARRVSCCDATTSYLLYEKVTFQVTQQYTLPCALSGHGVDIPTRRPLRMAL